MERKPVVLIVDSLTCKKHSLEDFLGQCYEVIVMEKGKDVLDYLQIKRPDLLLMNTKLSDIDGFEVLQKIRAREFTKDIPVLLMMENMDEESELQGLQAGAIDVISLPCRMDILKVRIHNIVERSMIRTDQAFEIVKQKQQIDRMALESILTIAHTVDTKDRYANRHSIRVAMFCREIARKMGYGEKEIEDLYHTALLHDIGKISVEDAILNKTSELTDEEYEEVKRHASIGADILENIKFIPGVVDAVRYHHEWYDGTGYSGVIGDKIPETSRIIAVADAYESMTSDRAYRRRLTKERVVEELIMGRGSQFDPYIVDVLLELLEEGLLVEEDDILDGMDNETGMTEAGALLRHVFEESVQGTQNELEKDSLTGFLNRKYFEEKINNYLLHPKSRGTFFMMDLDNFKSVNDCYGHKAGDELIQKFADVLRANIRENDFGCRIGGDEFAIFFPEMDKDQVINQRAEDIIKMFAEIKESLGYTTCSVSIGIMTKYISDEKVTCEMLYEKADKALYFVKNNGKDDYHSYAYMAEEALVAGENIRQMDLKTLMRQIAGRKYRQGAYAVEYDRFSYIYQFILRNIERNKQHVQVILITLEIPEGVAQPLIQVEDALMLLETSIIRSLRRGDVTTRYSQTQQIVVLMDTNLENGTMVAERIMTKFESLSGASPLNASYEIMEIPINENIV